MIEKKIFDLLSFGSAPEYLERTVKSDTLVHGRNILGGTDQFLENLSELGLTVTLRASSELNDLRERLAELPTGSALGESNLKDLHEIMGRIWHTLIPDSGGMIAYIISERRFPIERLVEDIGGLSEPIFSQGYRIRLSAITAKQVNVLRLSDLRPQHFTCFERSRSSSLLLPEGASEAGGFGLGSDTSLDAKISSAFSGTTPKSLGSHSRVIQESDCPSGKGL